jgi:hypothetical protein
MGVLEVFFVQSCMLGGSVLLSAVRRCYRSSCKRRNVRAPTGHSVWLVQRGPWFAAAHKEMCDIAYHGGTTVREALAVGLTGGPVAAILGQWCRRRLGTRGIERRLDALYQQVVAWQAAHDHQVELIDRRMRDVETSAARAENEARMVSVQMAEMSETVKGRIEQVEQRLDVGVLAGSRR